MKKYVYNDALREYIKKLNDDDLKFIGTRLSQRIGSDVGDAVEVIQRNSDMDRWLSSAVNADDFFEMVDQLDNCVQQEVRKRLGGYEQKEKKSR
jgi:hypothetical protein